MSTSVRINFNLPVPLFPLPEPILLPQSVAPLHIFEPRYRQMIEETLDRAGQIGVACFADDSWREDYDGTPALRPVVCLGQIVQHEQVSDGYQIVLHGICRARIVSMVEPSGDVQYRAAHLRPMISPKDKESDLSAVRSEMESLLCDTDLSKLESVSMVRKCLEDREIDTGTLLEVIAAALVHDADLRYEILAEASVAGRADLVRDELLRLEHLLLLAFRQQRDPQDYQITLN